MLEKYCYYTGFMETLEIARVKRILFKKAVNLH